MPPSSRSTATQGFVLSTVSAAVGPAGDLRFNVIEGRIAAVKLDGDIGPAGVQVLRFLRHLTEQQPLDNATLERWLLLAQDVPGVTLHAVLQPLRRRPRRAHPGRRRCQRQLGQRAADHRQPRLPADRPRRKAC